MDFHSSYLLITNNKLDYKQNQRENFLRLFMCSIHFFLVAHPIWLFVKYLLLLLLRVQSDSGNFSTLFVCVVFVQCLPNDDKMPRFSLYFVNRECVCSLQAQVHNFYQMKRMYTQHTWCARGSESKTTHSWKKKKLRKQPFPTCRNKEWL